MTTNALLQWLSEVVFLGFAAATAVRAARQPRRDTLDTALLFGAVGVIVLIAWLGRAQVVPSQPLVGALAASLLMALPYLMLRLVDDFAGVPRWLLAPVAGPGEGPGVAASAPAHGGH